MEGALSKWTNVVKGMFLIIFLFKQYLNSFHKLPNLQQYLSDQSIYKFLVATIINFVV